MASYSVILATLLILSLSTNPTSSISHRNFPAVTGDSVQLLGDAHFVGDGDSVQLNRPKPLSFGVVLHSTPLKFRYSTSLSSTFTFEISNRVALVIIPSDFPYKFARNTSIGLLDDNRLLGVEFDVNLCTISYSRVRNVSNINHVVKDGVRFTAWIDYRASIKRLDVRLNELGHLKPVEPLISYGVDLGEILIGEEVLLGLAGSNEGDEQISSVYSWRSEIKEVPKFMHSMPAVIPDGYPTVQASDDNNNNNKGCFLSGIVFATGCGALAALILLFVWSYVADRRKVLGEGSVCPVDFEYEKIGVVKVNNLESVMK